jgi:hypothetical protein
MARLLGLVVLLAATAQSLLITERVKMIIDDIKAKREWIQTVRPIYAFMNREQAKKAMEGEADPASLPEEVIDLTEEIMAEDPTVIHVSVVYDPAWSLETIAQLEAAMLKEKEQKGIQWEQFVKPFMPYWKSYMGPWLCHIHEVAARLNLKCNGPAPGTATRS